LTCSPTARWSGQSVAISVMPMHAVMAAKHNRNDDFQRA
jgi:hypothetical protein